MWFCDECGRQAEGGDPPAADPPVCPDHGPRWRLVRNAPCAETVIVRDGRVLLGRRAREPFEGVWEVPGGFVDRGEHPVQAAVREAREELGIAIVLTGLIGTYLEASAYGETLQLTAYLAEMVDPGAEIVPDPGEVSDWGWFSPGEFPTEMAGRERRRPDGWAAGAIHPLPADGLD